MATVKTPKHGIKEKGIGDVMKLGSGGPIDDLLMDPKELAERLKIERAHDPTAMVAPASHIEKFRRKLKQK